MGTMMSAKRRVSAARNITHRAALGWPSGGVSRPVGGGGGVSAPAPPAAPSPGGATAVSGGSDIMGLYTAALERLSTGGLSLEASLADIEEGKKQAIARGQQALVSGGLAGTTVMGGVPVAAEKTAGRARLAARGEAESKYLTTLASYAAFAQRAQEAAADRASAMQRLQMQIGSQERLATMGGPAPVSQSEVGGPSYTTGLSPDIQRGPPGSGYYGNYSQQFPSIYGQGGAEEPTPDWTGYRADIQAAGEGSQRIIGAPEWQQPYNQPQT